MKCLCNSSESGDKYCEPINIQYSQSFTQKKNKTIRTWLSQNDSSRSPEIYLRFLNMRKNADPNLRLFNNVASSVPPMILQALNLIKQYCVILAMLYGKLLILSDHPALLLSNHLFVLKSNCFGLLLFTLPFLVWG